MVSKKYFIGAKRGPHGGAIRRKTKDLPSVDREYIMGLINRVDTTEYGYSIRGGLTPQEQNMRNKGLVAMLYLSGRRISELLGRRYYEDVYEGVKVGDLKLGKVGRHKVLRMHVRILKKGTRKKRCPSCTRLNPSDSMVCSRCGHDLAFIKTSGKLKEVKVWKNLRVADPFCQYIMDWWTHLKNKGYEGPLFNINRHRAWQILIQLDPDVWNHWFRHQRLTQLSEVMDPYDLKEFAEWESIKPAVDYVHRAPGRILSKIEKADKVVE